MAKGDFLKKAFGIAKKFAGGPGAKIAGNIIKNKMGGKTKTAAKKKPLVKKAVPKIAVPINRPKSPVANLPVKRVPQTTNLRPQPKPAPEPDLSKYYIIFGEPVNKTAVKVTGTLAAIGVGLAIAHHYRGKRRLA
jgi:hypothetical protein